MPAWPTLYPLNLKFRGQVPAPWGNAHMEKTHNKKKNPLLFGEEKYTKNVENQQKYQ